MADSDTAAVLVHGGATTGRFWDLVVAELGLPSVAPDLPGRGSHPADLETVTLDGGADSVAADVASSPAGEARRLVLAAHSSGGLFVPAIVDRLGRDQVAAIVLLAASVPPEDGFGLDCMRDRHRSAVEAAMAAADAAGRGMVTPAPPAEGLRSSSGEELTDEQLAFATDPSRLVADSMEVYRQPVHYSLTTGIPTTYAVTARDRTLPPELQRTMAARLPVGASVIELDAGHMASLTQPAVVAAIIAEAAVGA